MPSSLHKRIRISAVRASERPQSCISWLLMRIAVYFNAAAGDEMPLDTLTSAISRAGHDIAAVIQEGESPAAAQEMPIDVLVAAGGDGTVARAARALAGRDLPIAILPLGTAN